MNVGDFKKLLSTMDKDDIEAIQNDVLNPLLNRLLAPTIKILDMTEYPMTVQERIDAVLEREKQMTQIMIRINEVAAKKELIVMTKHSWSMKHLVEILMTLTVLGQMTEKSI